MKPTKKSGPASPPAAQPSAGTTSAVAEYDWSQAQGITGFEGTDSSDLGIPFLLILQKGSPEVDKTNPQYAQKKIAGAEVGDIVNTLSREVIYKSVAEGEEDHPLHVIPAFHRKAYVEWKPRDSGGGIVATHEDERVLMGTKRNDKNQDVLPNGNLIVPTSYIFLTLLGEEPKKAVMSFTSTQLKKSRQWLNLMMSLKGGQGDKRFQLPMFSHIYAISTVAESNTKGSWFGWKIELVEMVKERTLISDMVDYAKQVAGGKVRAALPPATDADIPTEDGSQGKY
jgi:hypothetical protein